MSNLEFRTRVIGTMADPLKNAWSNLMEACGETDQKPVKGVLVLSNDQVVKLNSTERTRKGLRIFRRAYNEAASAKPAGEKKDEKKGSKKT